MTKKNTLILCLLAVAVITFSGIQFWAIPAQQARQEAYRNGQTDALTHDISAIKDFRSPYMGNASNTVNLFYALPLGDVPAQFQMDNQRCALTVSYADTVWKLGEEKVRRDLIYNSVAAMAAIDNLAEITYEFPGDTYSFTRLQVESILGAPLSALLSGRDTWKEAVQVPLQSEAFVAQFYAP